MKHSLVDWAVWLVIVGFILTFALGILAHVNLNDCTREGYSDYRVIGGCVE